MYFVPGAGTPPTRRRPLPRTQDRPTPGPPPSSEEERVGGTPPPHRSCRNSPPRGPTTATEEGALEGEE